MSTAENAAELRHEKLRERERWLIQQLERIKSNAISESYPLAMELSNLREHRDGRSIILENGVTYRYIGPPTPYQLPEERHPAPPAEVETEAPSVAESLVVRCSTCQGTAFYSRDEEGDIEFIHHCHPKDCHACGHIHAPGYKPAPPTPPVDAPRRMKGSFGCRMENCNHQGEHDEITEDQHPEPYYQNLCGYHGCQPVDQQPAPAIGLDREKLRAVAEEVKNWPPYLRADVGASAPSTITPRTPANGPACEKCANPLLDGDHSCTKQPAHARTAEPPASGRRAKERGIVDDARAIVGG